MSTRLIVLAPARPAGPAAEAVATLLRRADNAALAAEDDRVLYGDLFDIVPHGWPAAALTRQLDAGDAADHAWLRADPAHFRADPGSVRLMASGELGHSREEADALVAALAPLFGDEGFELAAAHPARWTLRPFAGNAAPDFPALPAPEAALGGDLFELWPEDDVHRRWRRLFSEAQIVLANHPVNRMRVQRGAAAINGLWFWGAGRLPARVGSELACIDSADPLLQALAASAGVPLTTVRDGWPSTGAVLLDLRRAADSEAALDLVVERWRSGQVAVMEWRTDRARWTLRRWHRLRFWR